MMMTFDNIEYLRNGNDKQRRSYRTLTENNIFEKLQPFSPILTGTIPINIDTEESDLDIICHYKNKDKFIKILIKEFRKLENFTLTERTINNHETILANFLLDEFKIEIFGQNRPTKEQESFRHMIIEDELLRRHGENFRQEIIKLKKEGLKTEQAFGKLLGITGNPYEELLNYKCTG
jgi:hypothetical protein